jgi:O-acetyl-ADP-ribose deacetylase (regulator of RNase III)
MERMLIREAEGNLLTADVDALVNTVNTVGVMGKGIALQFKRAYPDMFRAYERAAKAGELAPGRVQVWETGALDGPRFIINFPTKRHWRGPSRLSYIRDGLDHLAEVIAEREIRSIALPPLGCGNGGLNWADVKPLIEERLGQLPIDIVVYPPTRTPAAATMVERRKAPRLTAGRTALLKIMEAYQDGTLEAPSIIETQKLMYFLQEAGEPLRLRFVKGRYGPYADNLRHVLAELEGHFIVGLGDGSARVNEAEPLRLLEAGWRAAEAADLSYETEARISRVLALSEGYATAYGLELLASTHWVATHERSPSADPKEIIDQVREWSPRKGRLFSEEHVTHAWNSLVQHGWLRGARASLSA